MGLKILYVEDEITTQKLTANVLLNYCDDLYIAFDGEEGANIFSKQ